MKKIMRYEIIDFTKDEDVEPIICYDRAEAIKRYEEIENNGGWPGIRRFSILEDGTEIRR